MGIVRVARRPPGWIAPGPAPTRPEMQPADDEDLCFLTGDWRLFQKLRGHRWSLDDLVTAWVATRGAGDRAVRALDLGCGAGSVLLMVAWKLPAADVTGIEAQADRAAMGRRSILYNGAEARCRILDGDLRGGGGGAGGGFDLVTGTPPYFPRGTGTESDHAHGAACRFELRGGVEDYLAAAARSLAPDGTFTMCSSILELDRVAAAAPASGLSIVEHWTVIPRTGKPPLIAIDVLRRAGPRVDHSLTVRDTAGQWTPDFLRVRAELGLPPVVGSTPQRGRPTR